MIVACGLDGLDVSLGWYHRFAGSVLFWFRCAPLVWKRFVPHVIDMVRLFCEEVSACVVGSILVVQAAVMAFACERGYCSDITLRQFAPMHYGDCRRINYIATHLY